MQHQRWVVLSFVVSGILSGMVVQAALVSAFSQFAIADTRFGPFTMSTLCAILGAAVTFIVLMRNHQAVEFTDDVIDELAHTTWPTREETIRASTTVVVTTLMIAVLLATYDFVWKNLADLVLLGES